MSFQNDPNTIHRRLHLRSPIAKVYEALSADTGRASFWAESAVESEGIINFIFPNQETWDGRILEEIPPRQYVVQYYGNSVASFTLEEDGQGGTDLTLADTDIARKSLLAGSLFAGEKSRAQHRVK
jgi:uncharacterized protein YndB with AHSA1/START domain